MKPEVFLFVLFFLLGTADDNSGKNIETLFLSQHQPEETQYWKSVVMPSLEDWGIKIFGFSRINNFDLAEMDK